MPAVTNTMCRPEMIADLVDHLLGGRAPDFGLRAGAEPSVTCTPIWMMRSAFDMVSAWASVLATTKSTPCSPP
jgi:hypothetical protein